MPTEEGQSVTKGDAQQRGELLRVYLGCGGFERYNLPGNFCPAISLSRGASYNRITHDPVIQLAGEPLKIAGTN